VGDVVSFMHYKYLRRYVVMNEPCEVPWHKEEYVLAMSNKRCERCDIDVQRIAHPSMGGQVGWYGEP